MKGIWIARVGVAEIIVAFGGGCEDCGCLLCG